MSNQFARLFKVGDYQLLLTIEEDEENDDREIVVSRTDIDGITITFKIGGSEEQTFDAQACLSDFTQDKAVSAVASAKALCGRFRTNA